jgi:hypothetical protein
LRIAGSLAEELRYSVESGEPIVLVLEEPELLDQEGRIMGTHSFLIHGRVLFNVEFSSVQAAELLRGFG